MDEATTGLVLEQMVHVHQSARAAAARFQEQLRRALYVTPKNYLDFVAAYRSELRAQHARLAETVSRLDGGLQRLVQAYRSVHRRPYAVMSGQCLHQVMHACRSE